MQERQLPRPPEPLQVWQIDYIRPFPSNQGYKYSFTAVDMTGLGFAHPMAQATQQTTEQALEHLCASYEHLLKVDSD